MKKEGVLFFVFLCTFQFVWSMDNDSKGIIIPKVVQERSDLLHMLSTYQVIDYKNCSLKLLDGSLVSQPKIDEFATVYESNVDCKKFSLDTLITQLNFESYLQMNPKCEKLEQALFDAMRNGRIVFRDIESLSSDKHCSLQQFLIKEAKIDTRLLKPYTDYAIEHATVVPTNEKNYYVEKLLFFNNKVKIYGAYNYEDVCIKGSPRFSLLLVKNNEIPATAVQTINLRLKKDGYFFNENELRVDPTNLFCIASYDESQDYDKVFDVIDVVKNQIKNIVGSSLQKNKTFCCFGSKNRLYILAHTQGEQEATVEACDLITDERKIIATLGDFADQKIVGITSSVSGKHIIVTTQQKLFIINGDDSSKDVTIISKDVFNNDNDGYAIKYVSLNNKGTVFCIVTQPYVEEHRLYKYLIGAKIYLYDIDQASCFEITQELQGNHSIDSDQKPCLIDIISFCWNSNDSLLTLQCSYRYQSFYRDGTLSSSTYAGEQYAFIVPSSYNCWSEKDINKYAFNYSCMVASCNGEQALTNNNSRLKPCTKLINWCDENSMKTLDYFDVKKQCSDFDNEQRLKGCMLLRTVLNQQNQVIQLNKEETKIYNRYLSSEIKLILAKSKTIFLFEKNQSLLSSLKKHAYVCRAWSKNFLYAHPKLFLGSLCTVLFYIGYNHLLPR